MKDVSGFCGRNPGVCEKGKDAFGVFVQKAQFGAQMLMGFFKEQTDGTSASEMVAPAPEPRPAPAAANWPRRTTVLILIGASPAARVFEA